MRPHMHALIDYMVYLMKREYIKKQSRPQPVKEHHMPSMLTQYPTDLMEPSKVLLSVYRKDRVVPIAEATHAAYQIVGVALGNLFPDTPATVGATIDPAKPDGFKASPAQVQCVPKGCCDPDQSDEDCCKCLEVACSPKASDKDVEGILDNVFLKQLLSAAVKYLMTLWGI